MNTLATINSGEKQSSENVMVEILSKLNTVSF